MLFGRQRRPNKRATTGCVGRGRDRYLSDEQRELLVAKACQTLKPYVIGALYSGGRRRSLFDLEERDLDLDKVLVTFRATKNGEDHVLPLHPRHPICECCMGTGWVRDENGINMVRCDYCGGEGRAPAPE